MDKILNQLQRELRQLASPAKAAILQRFFKTGPGEYGEGDIFLGIIVPEQRKIAKKYSNIEIKELKILLQSKIHEERLVALLILVGKFNQAAESEKKEIFNFYLSQTKNINNWDLVDLSAEKIIGPYLFSKGKNILFRLAKSRNIWDRRIAVIASFYFIKQGHPETTLELAKILLNDKHDLIQKAVGWMLREIGKRCSEQVEEEFLKKYCRKMPRTMLRYAIERLPQQKRKEYLNNK